jgi:hypothetical protein
MTRRSIRSPCVFLLFAFLVGGSAVEAATIAAQQGDATIAHDEAAGTWTLDAGGASLTLALDPSRDFAIVSLTSASGNEWTTGAAADTFVRVGTRSLEVAENDDTVSATIRKCVRQLRADSVIRAKMGANRSATDHLSPKPPVHD